MADAQPLHPTQPVFREQYQLIVDLFTALNATEPIEEIVRQLAQAFSSTLPFTRFRFSLIPWGWILNEDQIITRIQSKSKADTAFHTVFTTQQSLLRQNIANEQKFSTDKNLLKDGLHSVLVVPICAQNTTIGALHFLHKEPNTYNKVHLHLIETLVPLFVSAIVQLRNRLETEAIDKVSQTLRQTRDLNTLSTLMLNHICDQGYGRVRIYLYNKIENALVGLAQTGDKPIEEFNGLCLPIAQDLHTQQTFEKKELQIYTHRFSRSFLSETVKDLLQKKTGEWAEFPLIVTENNEEHIVGKIAIDNATSGEPLNPARLHRLTGYMNHAATALHNALLYKQASEQAQDLSLQVQTHTAALEQQTQILEDNNRLLAAFHEIGQSLLATLNLDEILDILSEQVAKVGMFEKMMVALVDDDRQIVEVVRSVYTDLQTGKSSQRPYKEPPQYDLNDPNVTAEVARTGKTEIIEGWDDRFDINVSKPELHRDKISYFIPIKKGNHVLAVLATGSTLSEKPAIMARIKTIYPLLDQVAVAIEHARLHQRLQKTIKTQKAMIAIGDAVQKMVHSEDIETLLQICLKELISLDLNICSMAIRRILDIDQNLIHIFRRDTQGPILGSGEIIQRPALIKLWKTGKPFYVEDLETMSEAEINAFRSRFKNYPVRSFIDVPFDRGILVVHSTAKKAFSQHDVAILQEAGDLISVGLARLEDLEQKETRARQQEALLSIGDVIQKVTRPEEIEAVIREFCVQLDHLKIDNVTVVLYRLIDKESQKFETHRLKFSQEYVQDINIKPDIYNIWEKAQTIYRPDLKNDPMDEKEDFYETSPSKYGTYICSSIDIPHALGILAILSDKPRAFSKSDIAFLDQAADQLCVGVTRIKDLENLEQSNDQLQKHATEMERFTYTVSHDLKSPLITIRGYLGHIENNAQKGNQEYVSADLARIDKAATHMGDLLDDLLELSRIGRIDHLPETISLTKLAEQARDMLAGTIETHNIDIDIAPNMPHIFGDRLRLFEVMQNLIENAIKFMGEQPNPNIKIGVRTDAKQPICYIQDNGIGIEPRYHDKVFGLFDKLNKQTEGTGIGLALVRRILQHHEQKIWVESEGTGTGSTFCFTLPLPKSETQNKG